VGGTGGNISINGQALLSANTTIAATVGTGGVSSGSVTFNGAVNSSGANRTLAVNTTAATAFNGAVGNTLALTSLTTNAGGTTAINGGSVTTTGAQTYNDAITLSAATTLSTTNSAIAFNSSVNAGGNTLTVAAGTGNVTATNASNNFGTVVVTSANNVSLRDTNALTLGTSNMTGTLGLQTAGSITQSGAVTVGGNTTLNAGATNDITLNNAANNFNTVIISSGRDVNVVDATALSIGTSSVRTLTARTLSGNLTLAGSVTAAGTGSGTSITLASAQHFLNPSNSNLTPGAGSRWLIYSTNPSLDTRGTNLLTAYDFKQYNTLFGDTVLGTNDGFIYALAPQITANLTGSVTKIYDGNNSASITGLSISQSGAIDGDTVNLAALTSATYDDKNADTNKTVTSNTLSIISASNGGKQVFGYSLSSPAASGNVGTINAASLSVIGQTADNKVYDATTVASLSGGALSGILGSDNVSLITGIGAFTDKNVDSNKAVTVTGTSLTGTDAGNYIVSNPSGLTADITPASLSVIGQSADNKVYDATTVATLSGGALSGILGSDNVSLITGIGAFTDKNVDSNKVVTVTGTSLTGTDAGNYTVSNPSGLTANITPATISAVSGITADTKTYDATTGATLNTSAVTLIGLLGSDGLNLATATGLFADANADTGKTVNITGLSLGGADATNYTLASTTASATADITPRSLAITANAGQSKPLGATDPIFTFSVGGLGLAGADTLSGALSRNLGETAGNYAINQGTLNAGSNYAVTYTGAPFTITNPSASNTPSNAAGLGSLLTQTETPMQNVAILNVAATAAGGDMADSEMIDDDSDVAETCLTDPNATLNNPNTSILFNFGIRLPKHVKPHCAY
jgi:hypothetical protein